MGRHICRAGVRLSSRLEATHKLPDASQYGGAPLRRIFYLTIDTSQSVRFQGNVASKGSAIYLNAPDTNALRWGLEREASL
jgi:predicted outer membrane repeat protein